MSEYDRSESTEGIRATFDGTNHLVFYVDHVVVLVFVRREL